MKETKELQLLYARANDLPPLHALIQSVPYIGGALDVLLFAKAVKWKEQRVQELFEGIHKDIEKMQEEKLDKTFLESEECLSLFEVILRSILMEHDHEKRIVLRKAMTAAWTKDFSSVLSKEFLVNVLTELNMEQVRILKYLFDKHGKLGFDELRNLAPDKKEKNIVSYGELEHHFKWLAGSYEKLGLIRDLESKGLIFDWMVGRLDYSPFWFALTDFGRELVMNLIHDSD